MSSQPKQPSQRPTSAIPTSTDNQTVESIAPSLQPSPQKPASNTEQVVFKTDGWRITNQNRKTIEVDRLNGGKIAYHSSLPISKPFEYEIANGYVYGSFPSNGFGWFLLTSSPALGLMDKTLYRTSNDGKSWTFVADLSNLEGYPTGITFRNATEGWLTATYHGGNLVPLYHTIDGGKTWSVQTIDVPTGYKYGNSYPPVFEPKDSLKGTMKIEFHNDNQITDVTLTTTDGGHTWKK